MFLLLKIIVLDISGNIIICQNQNENFIKDNKEINSDIKKLNEEKRKNKILNVNDIKNTWNKLLEKREKKNECKDLTEIKQEYIVIETEKNGNCLFNSFAKNEKISTAEMRSKIMEYLRYNKTRRIRRKFNIRKLQYRIIRKCNKIMNMGHILKFVHIVFYFKNKL